MTEYKMGFIQVLVFSHVIFDMSLAIESIEVHSQLDWSSQVNNDAGTVNFGSYSVEEETEESKGIPILNVIACH